MSGNSKPFIVHRDRLRCRSHGLRTFSHSFVVHVVSTKLQYRRPSEQGVRSIHGPLGVNVGWRMNAPDADFLFALAGLGNVV
jgi:hypothetical protein